MASDRKNWLDWLRGAAVVFMIEFHLADSWLAPAERSGSLYGWLSWIGGLAAPSFLFMAGFSQRLADASLERRGIAVQARRIEALKRAAQLLSYAYAFRVAEFFVGFAFRNPDGWRDILRVDILNVIAVSLMLSALLTVGASPRLHLAICAIVAAAIAMATPALATWDRPASHFLDYLYGTYPGANFSLFNWAAFALAGSAAARIYEMGARARAFLLLGAALYLGGRTEIWIGPALGFGGPTSPLWLAARIGAVLILAGAWQLVPDAARRGLSWLRTLGRHSLFAYMVTLELTYGLLSRPLHRRAPLWGMLVAIPAMCAVAWALCIAAEHWKAHRATSTRPSVGV